MHTINRITANSLQEEYGADRAVLSGQRRRELVIIDPTVSDYQMLLSGISPNVEVHILDSSRDGITQITEIVTGVRAKHSRIDLQENPQNVGANASPLQGYSCRCSSVHIISHGTPGTLYLGNNSLELNNLEKYRPQLEKWGIAHLYIYGCKVAAGDAGAEFLTKLHQITQAEIYANPHLTGNAAKGGTWNLLPCTPAPLPLSPEALATYPGLLLEPEYEWAASLGGSEYDWGYSMAIDSSGNIYTTGYFWGTADFDPGPGTFNLTSAGNHDIFISKLNADGTFAWAKSIGGSGDDDQGLSIALDSSGNIYTTGTFSGSADFDPGPGTFNLTSAGMRDAFISKLNADGTFAWAKNFGGNNYGYGHSITVDSSGNIYTTGDFYGTVDFDPGSGTFNLTSVAEDIFISKLNADGTFAWAKSFEGSGWDDHSTITVDSSGNIYTTGWFSGTADFDPGSGTFNLTTAGTWDAFISKLNADGSFAWAKSFGSSGGSLGEGIAVDNSGNVYTTGGFNISADFDPGSGTFNLTAAGDGEAFISKLNADGSFAWAKSFGSSGGSEGTSIGLDSSGNIYTTGGFSGTADFDPGPGTFNLTSAGTWDAFISKLNADGTFAWAKNVEGDSWDYGHSIALDSSGNIYTTGNFDGTGDFDPGSGTANFTDAGNGDAFILKLTPGIAPAVTLNSTSAPTVNGVFTVTATFSEDVTGFDISDITLGNGTASNFTIVDATTYTFDITPTADGQVTVDIAAAKATDNAGNDNIAATQLTRNAAISTHDCPPMPAEPTVNFDAVSATISGTDSNNILNGNSKANAIKGYGGNDLISGLAGNDTIIGGSDSATTDNDVIFGNAGNDQIQGGFGNDIAYGGQDNDIVFGGLGDDSLWGDKGSDTLIGNDGNDLIYGGPDANQSPTLGDAIYGGNGDDTLSGNQGNDSISGGDGKDLLHGGTDNDLLHGDAGNDILYGDKGNDSLCAGDGDDTLYGGTGGNINIGLNEEKDLLHGGAGNDILFGSEGDDTLLGDSGNDILYGGKDNDIILGGDGSDILSGDKGNDTLTGGGGSDTFRFLSGTGTDVIVDFTDGVDKIGLAGNLKFSSLSIFATTDGFAAISAGGTTLAILDGVDLSLITSDDFMLI